MESSNASAQQTPDMDVTLNQLNQPSQAFLQNLAVPTTKDSQSLLLHSRRMLSSLFLQFGPAPAEVARRERHWLNGASGDFAVDLFWPANAANGQPDSEPLPTLLFLHGGGWCQGDLESYADLMRYLCAHSGCLVINVDYHLAPEHPFPAGLEDCVSALQWLQENHDQLNADINRLGIMGDSAGGNLATVTCRLAAERAMQRPAAQFLLYPMTDLRHDIDYPSRQHLGGGELLLSEAQIEWVRDLYLKDSELVYDARVSPLLAEDVKTMPPAFILTAGCDPLRDEGFAYARHLEKQGVPVEYHCQPGALHAFLSLPKALPQGYPGLQLICEKVRRYLK
ncbi:alpha/beta hydrolase [Pseudomaricurvus alkylphenolicus]|jgi:acetyl esterase|uniref:alpha/beta hydrolase n=1 Tax=Pseudomaricurvus alkylphenolicus TaxID=1306991 RepID=UPI0014212B63|nr:alpha/beta hydrolase [Pseudomaricurvus alkylphenolicus]NIB39653.1 alpha/beta hydrolase [Pseudomaricurvus alkylphenolicus]